MLKLEMGVGMQSSLSTVVFQDAFGCRWASLVAQTLKNLPAVQEIWVQALGQEDPLEKGMATTLEEPGGLQSTGWQRVGPNWATNTTTTTATTASLPGIKSLKFQQDWIEIIGPLN